VSTVNRTLFPHQVEGVKFLTDGGSMLAAEPGCGKTWVAIRVLQSMNVRRVLVVCPSILIKNWIREFTLAGSDLIVVDAARSKPAEVKAANVVVISVDWMRYDAAKAITKGTWDAMVVDESHYCSDPTAARTAATYSDEIKAGRTFFLTGTPVPKHAGNLWPAINRTAPERIDRMTYDQFTEKYCTIEVKKLGSMRFAQKIITGTKPEMVQDLKTRLGGWWLRQKKEDVLAGLPPKLWTDVFLDGKKMDLKLISNELDPELMEYLEWAFETGDMSALSSMSDQVGTLRRLMAQAKVPAIVEHIAGVRAIEPDMPLVVWGHHTAGIVGVATGLAAKGMRTRYITGNTSPVERDQIVQDFQAGVIDVLICNMRAAGVGLTLTRSNHCMFMELDWLPSVVEQAEDRMHRISATGANIRIDRLILANTIDEAVMGLLSKRSRQITALVEDSE
jgi:SWI/SNF-related matrix-associated actin-dependent regulator of chromatin subfamily A-like protein 1